MYRQLSDPRDPPLPGRFLAAAGLEVDEVTATRVVGHIDLGREHHTPWGVIHGGVYATAVETAASLGASAAVDD
jgi:1,4-dihydroxy-2-naphthoyl-CoA hydrolase